MREAETDGHEGKRKSETLWPIFKIHHQGHINICILTSHQVIKTIQNQ